MSNEKNPKDIVVGKFRESSFIYYDDIPMDSEIANFIYELNKNPHIITTNSCAGHDKFESNASYDFVSHPYLTFLVDEIGWDLFWLFILPEISIRILIHVEVINEGEKISIAIRSHFDDKRIFWEATKTSFLRYFPAIEPKQLPNTE